MFPDTTNGYVLSLLVSGFRIINFVISMFAHKIENFNYLNVAFISYKLTMWDLMLFSGGHTTANASENKRRVPVNGHCVS